MTRLLARLLYRNHRWIAELINLDECLALDWRMDR